VTRSVEIPLIKSEDVPSGVTLKSLIVGSTTVLFILLPEVIGLGASGVPVVEDFYVLSRSGEVPPQSLG
jgi:hypothetical protein